MLVSPCGLLYNSEAYPQGTEDSKIDVALYALLTVTPAVMP